MRGGKVQKNVVLLKFECFACPTLLQAIIIPTMRARPLLAFALIFLDALTLWATVRLCATYLYDQPVLGIGLAAAHTFIRTKASERVPITLPLDFAILISHVLDDWTTRKIPEFVVALGTSPCDSRLHAHDENGLCLTALAEACYSARTAHNVLLPSKACYEEFHVPHNRAAGHIGRCHPHTDMPYMGLFACTRASERILSDKNMTSNVVLVTCQCARKLGMVQDVARDLHLYVCLGEQ